MVMSRAMRQTRQYRSRAPDRYRSQGSSVRFPPGDRSVAPGDRCPESQLGADTAQRHRRDLRLAESDTPITGEPRSLPSASSPPSQEGFHSIAQALSRIGSAPLWRGIQMSPTGHSDISDRSFQHLRPLISTSPTAHSKIPDSSFQDPRQLIPTSSTVHSDISDRSFRHLRPLIPTSPTNHSDMVERTPSSCSMQIANFDNHSPPPSVEIRTGIAFTRDGARLVGFERMQS